MRSSNAFPGVLPTLRPATDATTATTTAAPSVHHAASSMTTTAVQLQDSTGKTMEFEEEWHRPPSDLTYLQDLLATIDAQERHHQLLESGGGGGQDGAANPAPGLSTMAQRERAVEEQELAELRMRECQVAAIEHRRRRSRRRCDAVDAAFQQALQRRLQAMQHLAADPPAERLVGQSMMQYVPAALLPDDVVDREGRHLPGRLPLAPRSAVESRMQRTTTGPARTGNATGLAAGGTLTDRPAGVATSEQDAIVFLTQLDAGGRPGPGGGHEDERSASTSSAQDTSARDRGRQAVSSGGASAGGPTSAAQPPLVRSGSESSAAGPDEAADLLYASDDEERLKGWARPATVTGANMARWHELGYHVVVVGGESGNGEAAAVRRAVRSAAGTTTAGAPSTADGTGDSRALANAATRSKRAGAASRGASGGEWEWMQLAPLPSVCLVQRRLPEEDMSATELRERRQQQGRPPREHGTPSAPAPAASSAERDGQGGGPMWRSSTRGGRTAPR